MRKHLAIFSKEVLQELYQGKKTIETRFSKKKLPPYGEVGVGDIVYIKPSGEDINGQFIVKKVIFIEGLELKDWQFLQKYYGNKLSLGTSQNEQDFFKNNNDKGFATLIFISNIEQFITSPIKIEKKDKRGWVVLDNS